MPRRRPRQEPRGLAAADGLHGSFVGIEFGTALNVTGVSVRSPGVCISPLLLSATEHNERIRMLVRDGREQVLKSMLSRSKCCSECDVTYKQRGGEQKLTYIYSEDI